MYYNYLDRFRVKPNTFYDLLESADYMSATNKIKKFYLDKSKEENKNE